MTTLMVDIGDITIPNGFRKDCAVFRAPNREEHFVSQSGFLSKAGDDWPYQDPRIVLIPEPQPYVWPLDCRIPWGWTMNASGEMFLHPRAPQLDADAGVWRSGYEMKTRWVLAWTTIPIPTRDHFTDWKTPLINPHWKGE